MDDIVDQCFLFQQTEPQIRIFSQFEQEKEPEEEPQNNCKPFTYSFLFSGLYFPLQIPVEYCHMKNK